MENKYMKYIKIISDIVIFISTIISSIVAIQFNTNSGYNFLFWLPLLYFVLYILVYRKILFAKFRFFLSSYSIFAYVRYVVMPIVIVTSGYYGGRSDIMPTEHSFQMATWLMIYEYIIVTLAIIFFERKFNPPNNKKGKIKKYNINNINNINNYYENEDNGNINNKIQKVTQKNHEGNVANHSGFENANKYGESQSNEISEDDTIKLPPNSIIYWLFILFAIIIAVAFPNSLSMFSFITPRVTNEDVYLTSMALGTAVVTYILFTAKFLIYILIMSILYKQYKKTNKNVYKWIAFGVTIINICIFYGLNRSDLVVPACASLLLYMKLFKDYNIFKYITVGAIVVILVSSIMQTRQFSSASGNQSKLVDLADNVQGYFGGVYNVAMSIETYEYYPESRSIKRIFFDTLRPFIGINIFLKNSDMQFTNDYFNKRIYLDDHTAQIVPVIGQGYINLGFVLSPLLEIFIIFIAYLFERIINKTQRIELYYLISICLLRMGFIMGQNTGNMSNEISMNLVLFMAIYFLNNFVKVKRKKISK